MFNYMYQFTRSEETEEIETDEEATSICQTRSRTIMETIW